MEMPKYFRKMMLRNVYRLAQPRLMMILPSSAHTSAPAFTSKEMPVSKPAATAPSRYVMHIQAMAKAHTSVLESI